MIEFEIIKLNPFYKGIRGHPKIRYGDVYVFMRCFSHCLMEIMTYGSGMTDRSVMNTGVNRYPAAVRHPIRPAAALRARRRVPGPGWLGSGRR